MVRSHQTKLAPQNMTCSARHAQVGPSAALLGGSGRVHNAQTLRLAAASTQARSLLHMMNLEAVNRSQGS